MQHRVFLAKGTTVMEQLHIVDVKIRLFVYQSEELGVPKTCRVSRVEPHELMQASAKQTLLDTDFQGTAGKARRPKKDSWRLIQIRAVLTVFRLYLGCGGKPDPASRGRMGLGQCR